MAFWRRRAEDAAPAGGWLEMMAPFDGEIVRLDDVPDPVFQQRMVGDGAAVNPASTTLLAPSAGTLTNLFPTGHAAGITTADGVEVLVHIGMDTVQLKGEGFRKLAEQGQRVSAGAPLIEIDLDVLRTRAKSLITPVVITKMDMVDALEVTDRTEVRAGQDWLLRVRLKSV